MKRYILRVLLLTLLLPLGACSPFYVLRAGYEQAKILSRRQPIPRLVEDPRTDPETREKLRLVLDARDFAAQELSLDAGQSYTTYSWVDSDTLALVLSAAHKDRFEAHTWWFPIVGSVPYKGFFSERSAQREIERLQARGLDTSLRPTSAFSTLGWFNDPLMSTLLRYGEVSLVNTVIHEIFHNTYYAAGQAQFNESVANFVGARGAIEFFCRREGENGPRCQRARDAWADDLLFGEFLSAMVADLEALYARTELTSEQKVVAREGVFAGAQHEFAETVRPQLRVSTFASFGQEPLNNATLIGRRLYYGRLDLFELVYERYGRDLPLTIEAIVAAARGTAGDPYAGVEGLLER
ncbi:MAG: aminopeptidase [Gemmatimonadetes bacterium]|nr:aminopeptidase [Gemmatimonadota bacterium]